MCQKKMSAKQKITCAALELFSQKGFTETSVREIAEAVGIRPSSLYTHFKSKASILEHLLDDYKQRYASKLVASETSWARLTKDATTDDILACFTIHFPKESTAHYLKMIVMLFQEQCRNESVQSFMTKDLMFWHEEYVTAILCRLVEVGALDPEIDIDFWAKLHANINYASMARYVLGIGESTPAFKGKGIGDMKRALYDTIFQLHGTNRQGTP